MNQEEMDTFKELLAKYLDIQCTHCGTAAELEDRHIITCTGCGVIIGDLKTLIEKGGRA